MALEKIGETLKRSITRIGNAITLDKKMIDGIIKDIQRALIESDVNIDLVFSLTQKIKKIAYDENIKGIDKKEQLISLIHDEIFKILGGESKELKLGNKTKIMFIGLYGSGKTTSVAKVGFYYAKRGRKVALVGLDTDRPAAMEQLEQMGEKAKLKVFIDKKEKDPVKIYKKFADDLKDYDLILIDTAGRDGLNKDLITQIEKIDKTVNADYRILIMSSDVGQVAKSQVEKFQEALNINGVIITKMDGTSKAGGALTACAQTGAPVFFIGTGEYIHDIEIFNTESFINRLLGMGDLSSLLEKVRSMSDEKQMKKTNERLEEGKFTLLDVYSQLEQMNSMGSMDKILSMIPGFGNVASKVPKSEIEKQEQRMKKWKSAINSMTEEEIENPEILEKQTTRIARAAKGSGTTTTEIRSLLKQYKLLKDMIYSSSADKIANGQMDKKTMQKIARQMRGKVRL